MPTITSSALSELHREMGRFGADIAAQDVLGYKQGDVAFSASITNDGRRTIVSAINSTPLNNYTAQGELRETGIKTDIALQGEGAYVVQSPSGETLFSRVGSFRFDSKGQLINHAGFKLLGWEVAADGSLPQNNAQLESLKVVNTRNVAARASATTKIDLGMNWNADAKFLQGAGDTIKFSPQGANKDTRTYDIILPDNSTSGAIKVGDQFILKSGSITDNIFEYGGIASTKAISPAYPIYNSSRADEGFKFSAGPSAPGILVEGDSITIGVGTRSYTLVAKSSSSSDDAFNSLSSLATKLNRLEGVTARIVGNSTLYIASKNANEAITFTDVGAATLKSALGLSNVAAADPAIQRFATMKELESKISATAGLGAEIIGSSMNFYASSALENLSVDASSKGLMKANEAYIGDNTVNGSRSIKITAHDNALVTGDFVRIKDFALNAAGGAVAVDGIYAVMAADRDTFTIAAQTTVAVAPAVSAFDTTKVFTYQKVAGQIGSAVTIAAGVNISTTDANTVVINNIPLAGYGAAAVVADDIVYITGFGTQNTISVPDGYYKVTAVGGGNTTLVATGCAAGAVAAAASTDSIKIQKVGQVAAGGAVEDMDTLPIQITTVADTTVRMHIPNHKYVTGDLISLEDLGAGTIASNGLVFTKDKHYTITAAGANYIEFTADSPDPVVPITNGFVGYTGSIENAAAYAINPLTSLGAGACVNDFSRLYTALGLNSINFETALTASYDPLNPLKNFAGGEITKNIETYSVTVYDSLGNERTIMMGFAKLFGNTWAVEVYGIKDDTGTPQIRGSDNKPIASGNISFNGAGELDSVGTDLKRAIQFQWNGGADQAEITINWGAIGGLNDDGTPGTTGLTQVATPFNVRFASQDGQAPGKLQNISITENGDVVAQFDNGTSQVVFRIPIATFKTMSKLDAMSGGVYRANIDSGLAILIEAGGSVKIIAGSVEGSNVDSTKSTLSLMDLTHKYGLNATVIQKQEKADEALLRAFA